MKTKSFQSYLEKRLDQNEIAEIEAQAKLEFEALSSLQNELMSAIEEYMSNEKIGFRELVRRLGISPSQMQKIQKGTANITLATLAHISALLNKRPHIIFEQHN